MKKILTIIILAATAAILPARAQNVTVFTRDGGRADFKEADIVSIDFASTPRPDLSAPSTVATVDLGLPSGTKWASCNLGAATSTAPGAYLAWAEREEKSEYSWGYYFDEDCHEPLMSISGNPDYDVVAAEWGGDWRMPTLAEMQELSDLCTWAWTELDGVHGALVTGPSGASIFLPAAGTRQGTNLYLADAYGAYLTGTRDDSNRFYARGLVFYADGQHWLDTNLRDYGQSIRPVMGSGK